MLVTHFSRQLPETIHPLWFKLFNLGVRRVFRFATDRKSTILLSVALLAIGTSAYAASSAEFVNKARAYLEKNQLREAVIEFKNALQQDPKNVDARFLLGKTYVRFGDGVSAEKEFDQAIRLGKDEQSVAPLLAEAYLLQGQPKRVLDEIEIKDSYPKGIKADLYAFYANAYLALQDVDKAETSVNNALKQDASSLQAKLGQVRVVIAKRQLDEALKLSNELVKSHADNDNAWTLNGEILRLNAEFEKSAKSFARAEELNPNNNAAKLGGATVAIAMEQYDAALKKIESVRRLVPNHPMANFLKGAALYRKQDMAGAEEALNIVIKSFPEHLPSLQILGAIHYSKGRFEQAEYNLNKVAAVQPDNIAAVKLLGATRIQLKQPKQAITILEPLTKQHANDAQLMALLGSAYMQVKDQQDKGLEYLSLAAEISPNAASIHTQLALAQLATGQKDQAIEKLESVVNFDSQLLQADLLLALVHMQNKEFEKALEQTRKIQTKSKNNPVAFNLTGAAYIGLKKHKQAREQFNKALKVDKDFVPAIMNIARLDELQGKTSEAEKGYKKILKIRPGHVGSFMALARMSEAAGDSKKALDYVQNAMNENPDNPVPGLFLVQYYLKQDNALRAVSVARELKEKNPKNGSVLKSLGMAQFASDQKQNALATFQELSRIYPDSPESHYLVGKAQLAVENLDKAREALKKANKIDGKHVPTLLSMAELELKSNQPKKAISIAKSLQKQLPKVDDGYILEGDIQMHQKNTKAAEKAYADGFTKVKSGPLLAKMFTTGHRNKNAKAYLKDLNQWIKDNPDDTAVIMLAANYYQSESKNKEAAKLYHQVVDKQPNNVLALNNLAWLLHLEKNADSKKYAAKAYELFPKNPSVADTYGWILVENGEVNRGLTILKQAAMEAPHLYDIRYHVAVALDRLGRKSEAKKELEQIFAKSRDFQEAKNAQALYEKLK